MFVRGEQRIGFFAVCSIKAQTELFFDYSYHKAVKNDFLEKPAINVDWMKKTSGTGDEGATTNASTALQNAIDSTGSKNNAAAKTNKKSPKKASKKKNSNESPKGKSIGGSTSKVSTKCAAAGASTATARSVNRSNANNAASKTAKADDCI